MSHLLVVDDSPIDRAIVGKLLSTRTSHFIEFASDGIQALEHMDARLPLAVVTDLQMPEMDGMSLVQQIRREYPKVPVILMTGQGSEDIGIDALMAGAADFVPKTRLETDLAESIQCVLALTVTDRPHKRLAACLEHEEMRYQIDNEVLLIPPLVEHFQRIALDLDIIGQEDALRFSRSIMEAIRNAIFHGNLELPFDQVRSAGHDCEATDRIVADRRQQLEFRDRRVFVQGVFTRGEAKITIRDEGTGFDTTELPDIATDPALLTDTASRGLVLIRAFMDQTSFNSSGNEITLVKRPTAAAC